MYISYHRPIRVRISNRVRLVTHLSGQKNQCDVGPTYNQGFTSEILMTFGCDPLSLRYCKAATSLKGSSATPACVDSSTMRRLIFCFRGIEFSQSRHGKGVGRAGSRADGHVTTEDVLNKDKRISENQEPLKL